MQSAQSALCLSMWTSKSGTCSDGFADIFQIPIGQHDSCFSAEKAYNVVESGSIDALQPLRSIC